MSLDLYKEAVSSVWCIVGYFCTVVCLIGCGVNLWLWWQAGRP